MEDKIISACGNDCSLCLRYTKEPYVKSEEELRAAAVLWHRIGYRDRVVTNEEIACRGCSRDNWCRYAVKACADEKGADNCGGCRHFPCDTIEECFRVTESFEPSVRRVCNDEEYDIMKRAFFEKQKNLEEL